MRMFVRGEYLSRHWHKNPMGRHLRVNPMRASSREKAAVHAAHEELNPLTKREQQMLEDPDILIFDGAAIQRQPKPYRYRGKKRSPGFDSGSIRRELGTRTTAWRAFC